MYYELQIKPTSLSSLQLLWDYLKEVLLRFPVDVSVSLFLLNPLVPDSDQQSGFSIFSDDSTVNDKGGKRLGILLASCIGQRKDGCL